VEREKLLKALGDNREKQEAPDKKHNVSEGIPT
jgi:hypothetical protein